MKGATFGNWLPPPTKGGGVHKNITEPLKGGWGGIRDILSRNNQKPPTSQPPPISGTKYRPVSYGGRQTYKDILAFNFTTEFFPCYCFEPAATTVKCINLNSGQRNKYNWGSQWNDGFYGLTAKILGQFTADGYFLSLSSTGKGLRLTFFTTHD